MYLKHDSAYLYVCMIGAPGTPRDRFASVYLDTKNDKASIAQADDDSLRVYITSDITQSLRGSGVPGGYVTATLPGWVAKASLVPNQQESAEWKIPLALTGVGCKQNFGLAVHHQDVTATGDDFGWPNGSAYDKPMTWQEVSLENFPCGSGMIAYVFRRDTATAADFKTLLVNHGYTVDLIPLSTVVTTTNFANYQLIIVADDTGSLDTWGSFPGQVSAIGNAGIPILGLGEGGYAFFGKLGSGIGWPHGWHGPLDSVYATNNVPTYYQTPYDFTGFVPGPFPLYLQPVNEVGIYLVNNSGVLPMGLEPPFPSGQLADHAPLIVEANVTPGQPPTAQPCRQLWGYSGGPTQMNAPGSQLFINAVVLGFTQETCPIQQPPPTAPCVGLIKTAIPPDGTPVNPGDIISYTLTYTISQDSKNCPVREVRLVDPVPIDTLYVPGSATYSPITSTSALIWNLGNPAPGATGSESFAVSVLDTQCHDQRRVNNIGRLHSTLGVVTSNLVSHPVDCPPVTFPNTQPPYAEDDIQIYPYPLVTGQPTQVSARVQNLSPQTQTVTVTFQFSSVDVFGIGLNFTALPVPGNPKVVTLPPSSTVQVNLNWIPIRSGHYCIQVMVQGAGFAPIYTQHNLDVTEDLRPGITDTLSFQVGNPTASMADILLVVDNTCPGWTAWITPTTVLTNVGANDTDIRTAFLNVIPPSGPPLGTACHIDVQGWIGGKLIGGIRKLDVPPVHLPSSNPPWEEKEISTSTYPPVAGQPVSYCIELQNPLAFTRSVTLEYQVAYFGAGLPFTSVATQTFTLPPNSIDKYCITWTPTFSGHTCLRVILKQPGFQDQMSQHNIMVVQPIVSPLGTQIPFQVGNPYQYTRTLRLDPRPVGIDPLWIPHITPDPPPVLGPGQIVNLNLELVPAVSTMSAESADAVSDYRFGDSSRVQVGLYLDEQLESGFTVEYGPPSGKIAYVYKSDTPTAGDFKMLLESVSLTVQLIPLSAVTSTNFSGFDLILIAHDTGYLNNWGTAAQLAPITAANKPIMGLGEGGYAFFGQLGSGLGWPHGWHGPLDKVFAATPGLSYYHAPYDLGFLLPGPFPIYAAPVDEVGIYLPGNPGVSAIGLEPPYPTGLLADHAPLIANYGPQTEIKGCYQLWGYAGGPAKMNGTGSRLFINAVAYGLNTQCPPPPQPPPQCTVTLTKVASPPSGTPVKPGDSISYTLTYTVSNTPGCTASEARLIDPVPMDTLLVPGSATDSPITSTSALIWNLGNIVSGTVGSESFKVYVLDTQCNDQRRVNNMGRLSSSLGIVTSNLVSHPVDCPPVTFPNTQPPYAEDDIELYPYPLVTGKPTQVSVRVRNLMSTTQVVTVSFQTSPDRFGIGLNFADLTVPGNPKVVTLPPYGMAIVKVDWTPVSSGHYCIQVKVEGSGFAPIYTQHNLDVTEDLQAGITDTLMFKVGNPTAATSDILLVVDNTCPGWTAWITPTTVLTDVAPNDTDIRTAFLNVIPPSGPPLGTACHIDVQGWLGGKLIGGIRKLDVPPVQLPPGDPWWEEKEISVNPDPPTAGQTISYCVELQNPLPFSRTVTLIYSYADFGAGIPFTPIQTKTVTLPPSSIDKYCINWPTSGSGTLHRCLLVTLKQPGFQDQRSQRNVDFVRPIHGTYTGITVTFGIGNPNLFTRTLKINPVLVGIDPNLWIPHIIPDPPPDLGPNQMGMFTFELVPAISATEANAPTASSGFGDSSRVEVGVYLDDEPMGGFTVDYTPIQIYLPVVMRQ